MSCNTEVRSSFIAWPARHARPIDRPAVLRLIVVLYKSFQEALELRREAHRRYHLTDE
jgi:hypothetical protein